MSAIATNCNEEIATSQGQNRAVDTPALEQAVEKTLGAKALERLRGREMVFRELRLYDPILARLWSKHFADISRSSLGARAHFADDGAKVLSVHEALSQQAQKASKVLAHFHARLRNVLERAGHLTQGAPLASRQPVVNAPAPVVSPEAGLFLDVLERVDAVMALSDQADRLGLQNKETTRSTEIAARRAVKAFLDIRKTAVGRSAKNINAR